MIRKARRGSTSVRSTKSSTRTNTRAAPCSRAPRQRARSRPSVRSFPPVAARAAARRLRRRRQPAPKRAVTSARASAAAPPKTRSTRICPRARCRSPRSGRCTTRCWAGTRSTSSSICSPRATRPTPTAPRYRSSSSRASTFHNGKSVTADDVVYSFQRILNPKTAAIGAPTSSASRRAASRRSTTLTVPSSSTSPNVIFYEALADYRNAIVPVGYNPKGMTGAIGTGPWKVTGFQPGQQTEFAANPNYWGDGPYADQLTMIEFADPAAKLNALLGGTVDHITLLASAQASVVSATRPCSSSGPSRAPGSLSPCAWTRSRSTTCACARPSA